MTASERQFDEWMNEAFPQPSSRPDNVAEIIDLWYQHCVDHAYDFDWCTEQDAMYWEGRQGEPCNMEEFDEETRERDQRAYEEWLREIS